MCDCDEGFICKRCQSLSYSRRAQHEATERRINRELAETRNENAKKGRKNG